MKTKKTAATERNWFLVFIASLLMVIGVTMVLIATTDIAQLGWWNLLIGLSGLTIVYTAIMSIVKNDPAWILLGLLMPN